MEQGVFCSSVLSENCDNLLLKLPGCWVRENTQNWIAYLACLNFCKMKNWENVKIKFKVESKGNN